LNRGSNAAFSLFGHFLSGTSLAESRSVFSDSGQSLVNQLPKSRATDPKGTFMTPETRAVSEELCQRIQGEFLEMPGLRLTSSQACRLWGLDRDVCGQLLAQLVDVKFLTRTRDGSFMQLDRTQAADRSSLTHR
jgi:hypothetical protein